MKIFLKDFLLNSRTTSYWLKDAINTALLRDPVDALQDAEELVLVLKELLYNIQKG